MTAFETLLTALDPLGLPLRERLRPPAASEDLQRVLSLLPAPPPQAWHNLYTAHDGEGDNWVSGTFLDLKFLPLAEVHRVLLEMQGILEYADPWEPDEDDADPRIGQDFPSLWAGPKVWTVSSRGSAQEKGTPWGLAA